MINFRIVARVFSQVLIIEGIFMLLAAIVSWIYGEKTAAYLLYSALITLVTGILVFTPLRNEEKVYSTREGYIIITFIWLLFSVFGSLPYLFSSAAGNFTDAFFESISGFTTTGATVFTDIESLPHGIVFWRSLTQWLGGIAIIILSLYVLPVNKSLNIQLSTAEFSGQVTDKIHPKVIEISKRLISIYILLTLIEIILLLLGKMSLFDSICHSLSTLSTGGFSSRNNGIAAFTSPYIKAVIALFMFFAGANPALFYFAIKRNFSKIIHNTEFAFYTILVILFSFVFILTLIITSGIPLSKALSSGFFNVISIITTTGYYTENFTQWGSLIVLIIFILMFIGGMSGSATGGIKVIRLIIVGANSRKELKSLIHPNAYLPVHVDQKRVSQSIIYNLLIFIILYFILICVGTSLLSLMDYDIITSFSTTVSMLGNIGPGLGKFGPFTTYADIPSTGKWILSALMLLGRLEILSVVIIFTRSFYKK